MKTGILTFHAADSYGAVLQAYALQQTVLSMGSDCEFVDIQMGGEKKPAPQPAAASPAAAVFARRLQAEGQKRAENFARFRREHMRISHVYQPTDDIAGDYDLFIAGSDQIWNMSIPDADARYFLPFARAEQRCSYAASFGGAALPEKAEKWAAGQLKAFKALSVREASGVETLEKLTGRQAQVCLDPTLLPDRELWHALADEEQTEKSVMLFLLSYDEQLYNLAKAEAESRGLPLQVISAGFMPKLGTAAWVGGGVSKWLSAIRSADCVFTNSFHGMVFSMIFQRPFRVARLGGELSKRNGRIEEMLEFLGISQAMEQIVRPDYAQLWQRMEPRRQASLEYLKGLIG